MSPSDQREAEAYFEGGRRDDEEVLAGGLAQLRPADNQLDTLCRLRVLDEQVEAAGHSPILDSTDQAIIDEALRVGRLRYAMIAEALGINRSTVSRRVRRLLDDSKVLALCRRAKILLGEAKPQPWEHIKAMARTYAWGGVGEPPEGALDLDNYHKLAAMYRAGAEARRLLFPPIGLQLERRGDKNVITGPGPLDPILKKAVRSGRAERIYDPLRCHGCGRFVSQPSTGRTPKYCSERCRSRYRRQR